MRKIIHPQIWPNNMNNNNDSALWVFLFAVMVAGFLAVQSAFILNPSQQALVMQMGKPKMPVGTPGLHFKIPLLQNVAVFDKRAVNIVLPDTEIKRADQSLVLVSAMARYRVTDMLQFMQRFHAEAEVTDKIKSSLQGALQNELAKASNTDLANYKKQILLSLRSATQIALADSGIEITDVGFNTVPGKEAQAELLSVMEAKYREDAATTRAQAAESAAKIKATADAASAGLMADAARDADSVKGNADREAGKTAAMAFGKLPSFLAFYRSLVAYKNGPGEAALPAIPDTAR